VNNKADRAAAETSPRISIIIPCYNQGQFINESVESVLNQTLQDFEIIIINDGSTDSYTNELLRNYDKPKTTVYTIENAGLPAARNYGIRKSRGEYFLPLDADDKIDPEFLEKCVPALNSNPDLGFVYAYTRFFGGEEGEWRNEQFDERKLLLENTVCVSSLVRRQAFEEVGGYNIEMRQGYEDWDFWVSMVEKGWSGYRIPEYLFYYRKRPGTMCAIANLPNNRTQLIAQICRNHFDLYRENLPYIIAEKEKTLLMKDVYIKRLEKRNADVLDSLFWRVLPRVKKFYLRLLRVS